MIRQEHRGDASGWGQRCRNHAPSTMVVILWLGCCMTTGCAFAGTPKAENNKAPDSPVDSSVAKEVFPSIVVDRVATWKAVEEGRTYELKLVKADEPAAPKSASVHKVVKRIPDFSAPASWNDWLKKAGAPTRAEQPDRSTWYFHEKVPGGTRGVTFDADLRLMTYGTSSWGSNAELKEAAEKTTPEKMRGMGEAGVKTMGWWPANVNPKIVDQSIGVASVTNLPGKYIEDTTVTYSGLIEGVPVDGEGLLLKIYTLSTGRIRGIDLRWVETERYKELPCKTVEEAFDCLNRGEGQTLPTQTIGSKAEFAGLSYWLNKDPETWVQPLFKFKLVTPAGYKYDAYVPAIRSEYFRDPKHQILIRGMEEAVKGVLAHPTGPGSEVPEKDKKGKDEPVKGPPEVEKVRP
jgi:hypothetical protein